MNLLMGSNHDRFTHIPTSIPQKVASSSPVPGREATPCSSRWSCRSITWQDVLTISFMVLLLKSMTNYLYLSLSAVKRCRRHRLCEYHANSIVLARSGAGRGYRGLIYDDLVRKQSPWAGMDRAAQAAEPAKSRPAPPMSGLACAINDFGVRGLALAFHHAMRSVGRGIALLKSGGKPPHSKICADHSHPGLRKRQSYKEFVPCAIMGCEAVSRFGARMAIEELIIIP